ncbi:Hypothetical protein NTJ_10064 [Nesidiocoris tenuis]|uniref:Uncharacterized protein n=1 Tax=Nesidiocoris tenuis TaxID=355587 RepID=A0ABN7AYJ6_9HEMI|nr:Hypothetical protein NTJ_10064 [Nesidiocoris tenuis]
MVSEWGVVGLAEGQVPDETDNGFNQWPARWRMKQFHDDLNAVEEAYSVLGDFSLWVAGCEVPESADL